MDAGTDLGNLLPSLQSHTTQAPVQENLVPEAPTSGAEVCYVFGNPKEGNYYFINSLTYIGSATEEKQTLATGALNTSEPVIVPLQETNTSQPLSFQIANSSENTSLTTSDNAPIPLETLLGYLSQNKCTSENNSVPQQIEAAAGPLVSQADSMHLESLCGGESNISDLIQERDMCTDIDKLYTSLKQSGFVSSPTKQPGLAGQPVIQTPSLAVDKTVDIGVPQNPVIQTTQRKPRKRKGDKNSQGKVKDAPEKKRKKQMVKTKEQKPKKPPVKECGKKKMLKQIYNPDAAELSEDSVEEEQCYVPPETIAPSGMSRLLSQDHKRKPPNFNMPSNHRQVRYGHVILNAFFRNKKLYVSSSEMLQLGIIPIVGRRLKNITNLLGIQCLSATETEMNSLKVTHAIAWQTRNTQLIPLTRLKHLVRYLVDELEVASKDLGMILKSSLQVYNIFGESGSSTSGAEYCGNNGELTTFDKEKKEIPLIGVTLKLPDTSYLNESNNATLGVNVSVPNVQLNFKHLNYNHCECNCCIHSKSRPTTKTVNQLKTSKPKAIIEADAPLPPGKFLVTDSGALLNFMNKAGLDKNSNVTALVTFPLNKGETGHKGDKVKKNCKNKRTSKPRKETSKLDLLQSAVDQVFDPIDLEPSEGHSSQQYYASQQNSEFSPSSKKKSKKLREGKKKTKHRGRKGVVDKKQPVETSQNLGEAETEVANRSLGKIVQLPSETACRQMETITRLQVSGNSVKAQTTLPVTSVDTVTSTSDHQYGAICRPIRTYSNSLFSQQPVPTITEPLSVTTSDSSAYETDISSQDCLTEASGWSLLLKDIFPIPDNQVSDLSSSTTACEGSSAVDGCNPREYTLFTPPHQVDNNCRLSTPDHDELRSYVSDQSEHLCLPTEMSPAKKGCEKTKTVGFSPSSEPLNTLVRCVENSKSNQAAISSDSEQNADYHWPETAAKNGQVESGILSGNNCTSPQLGSPSEPAARYSLQPVLKSTTFSLNQKKAIDFPREDTLMHPVDDGSNNPFSKLEDALVRAAATAATAAGALESDLSKNDPTIASSGIDTCNPPTTQSEDAELKSAAARSVANTSQLVDATVSETAQLKSPKNENQQGSPSKRLRLGAVVPGSLSKPGQGNNTVNFNLNMETPDLANEETESREISDTGSAESQPGPELTGQQSLDTKELNAGSEFSTENDSQNESNSLKIASSMYIDPVKACRSPKLPEPPTVEEPESSERHKRLSQLMEKIVNSQTPYPYHSALHVLADTAEVMAVEDCNKVVQNTGGIFRPPYAEVEKMWKPYLPTVVPGQNGRIQLKMSLIATPENRSVLENPEKLKYMSFVFAHMVSRGVRDGRIQMMDPDEYWAKMPSQISTSHQEVQAKSNDLKKPLRGGEKVRQCSPTDTISLGSEHNVERVSGKDRNPGQKLTSRKPERNSAEKKCGKHQGQDGFTNNRTVKVNLYEDEISKDMVQNRIHTVRLTQNEDSNIVKWTPVVVCSENSCKVAHCEYNLQAKPSTSLKKNMDSPRQANGRISLDKRKYSKPTTWVPTENKFFRRTFGKTMLRRFGSDGARVVLQTPVMRSSKHLHVQPPRLASRKSERDFYF